MTKSVQLEQTPFFQTLTQKGSGIKARRAELVAKQVFSEAEGKLRNIDNDLTRIEMDIFSHEDLAPTNTQSLVVASDSFDPTKWLNKYYQLLEAKRLKEEEKAIYEEIMRRQFEIPAVKAVAKASTSARKNAVTKTDSTED